MKKTMLAVVLAMFAASLLATGAAAAESKLEARLLSLSEGVQYLGSESDSEWAFVSYPGVSGLPEAKDFQRLSGCPAADTGVTALLDFDATLDRLGKVQSWMDGGQRDSAKGFRRMGRVYHRKFGEEVAVYRCETGTAEVYLYFVGLDRRPEVDRLIGLSTISIET